MNLINPAFAGADGSTDIGLNIRSQWANVQGAPETQSFIFGMPAGKSVGLGLSITNDKTFVENQTSFYLDFSYALKLNQTHDLYLGVKGGFNSYDVNTDGLLTYDISPDQSLMNADGRFTPNIGAGAYLRHEKYFIALSIPKILTPDRLERKDGTARWGSDKMHLYLAGGYDVSLNANISLLTSALLRYVDAAPISLDLTALIDFNKRFDLGASYRLNESISGILIFKAQKWLQIGYAYEVPLESEVSNIDNGTHEVMLKLKL
tara:strand:+ start:800 stop:1588 length:789 start_codon:yes stop_codon:yes gene_type:complete